jgi:hypothetical protein
MRIIITGIVLWLVGGCALSHEQEARPGTEPLNDRFTGEWLIDQPWRGGYAGTVYRFDDDGTAVAVASMGDRGPHPLPLAIGDGLVCNEPLDWAAPDDRTLRIRSVCRPEPDALGEIRILVFRWGADTTYNGLHSEVEISTPVGFTTHERWKKCETIDEQCDAVRHCEEPFIGGCYRH